MAKLWFETDKTNQRLAQPNTHSAIPPATCQTYLDTYSQNAPPIAFNQLIGTDPQQYAHNPLSLMMSSAHAAPWDSLDEAWSAIKDTVTFLIPLEDFITLGEQLYYLGTQDWEKFDATELTFAALGVATVIPIMKPLKPVLNPVKRFVKKYGDKPVIKAVSGVLGAVTSEAAKGRTEKLLNLLPFFLVIAEMVTADGAEQAFDLMINAIESDQDLWAWIGYFNLPAHGEGWTEDGAPPQVALYENVPANTGINPTRNPLSWVVPMAYAAKFTPRRIGGKVVVDMLNKLSYSKGKVLKDPKDLTRVFEEVVDALKITNYKQFRKYTTKESFINASIISFNAGLSRLRVLLKSDVNQRIRPELHMATMIYLAERMDDGAIANDNEQHIKIYGLYADSLFGSNKQKAENNRHGAQFHLVMLTYYLLQGETIVDVEARRDIYYQTEVGGEPELFTKKPYQRRVDIILEEESEDDESNEHWVEVKSKKAPLVNSQYSPSTIGSKGNHLHREFFGDLTGNQGKIDEGLVEPDLVGKNLKYSWRFQDFKTQSKIEGPKSSDLKPIRQKLCEPAKGPDKVYETTFDADKKEIRQDCLQDVNDIVEIQNTQTMLEDILLPAGVMADMKDAILEGVN